MKTTIKFLAYLLIAFSLLFIIIKEKINLVEKSILNAESS
ncbi:hypothetical protein IWQ47_003095 [Aquimarina sp. EL_43]|nr:hypothetical protein [Aquimarina sp. EL_35]MBG6152046.1 hypothetical protein [Aquimarina sp. EL_32]MBG6170010.1 hypothetical protein [Aquimarina sp. EL_43]